LKKLNTCFKHYRELDATRNYKGKIQELGNIHFGTLESQDPVDLASQRQVSLLENPQESPDGMDVSNAKQSQR
jgi:hypothetical protein